MLLHLIHPLPILFYDNWVIPSLRRNKSQPQKFRPNPSLLGTNIVAKKLLKHRIKSSKRNVAFRFPKFFTIIPTFYT